MSNFFGGGNFSKLNLYNGVRRKIGKVISLKESVWGKMGK